MASSPTLPLVDRLIPEGLQRYLLDARGKGESYQVIRDRLVAEHAITVTPQTVSNWCSHFEIEKADKTEATA